MKRIGLLGLVSAMGIAACGPPTEEESAMPLDACDDAVAASSFDLVEREGALGYPRGFDFHRGEQEFALTEGGRLLVLTRGAEAFEEAAGTGEDRALTKLPPARDTWAQRPTGAGFVDYGKSCQLRVNNVLNTNVPQLALLRFGIPATVTCGTIKQALLVMRSAQVYSPSLQVFPHRVLGPWTPGTSGLAGCAQCQVTSGKAARFAMPNAALAGQGRTTQFCSYVRWNITAMVQSWCANPASNFGVMLAGRAGSGSATFHSMEMPAALAASRPRLEITY
jgi:hypothetical protein